LVLVGVIGKVNSSLQPLDRRKAEAAPGTFNIVNAPKRMASNVLSVLLPFYASMQLGGARVALALLVAVAAGLGASDSRPGKHTPWDDMRRTLRTRKTTCAAILVAIMLDIFTMSSAMNSLLGYGSLLTSIVLVPLPLPTAKWSLIMGSQGQTSYVTQGSGRATLSKPSSPLVSSFENTLLTILSGLGLTVIAILYSLVSSSSPSLSHHTLGFSTLSIATATALVYFSQPSALRSQNYVALALGSFLIVASHAWEQFSTLTLSWTAFPVVSVALVGVVMYDTGSSTVPAAHAHSHDHKHDHDHHLHGNHSRLSAFLIARATPGSIIHSILIERDSRRIAYFGV
jgi:zinc transporter 5/7